MCVYETNHPVTSERRLRDDLVLVLGLGLPHCLRETTSSPFPRTPPRRSGFSCERLRLIQSVECLTVFLSTQQRFRASVTPETVFKKCKSLPNLH